MDKFHAMVGGFSDATGETSPEGRGDVAFSWVTELMQRLQRCQATLALEEG